MPARVGEGHRLVERQVDAHRLRGDLAVADRDQARPVGERSRLRVSHSTITSKNRQR